MKTTKDPKERMLNILIAVWSIVLLIAMGLISWGTVTVARLNNAYTDLADRPPQIVKIVEKQLQPIYTTIVGKQGPRGFAGKDSMSTTTIIYTENQVAGPKGDTGKSGRDGVDGTNAREVEFAYDPSTNTMYQRFIGTSTWYPITVIGESL